MSAEPSPLELRELEIDVELRDLWAVLGGFDCVDREVLACAVRFAYDRGFDDGIAAARTIVQEKLPPGKAVSL